MTPENNDQPSSIHDLTEKGREHLQAATSGAKDGIAAATEYIRANPWVAVAGAAVIGGVITALSRSHKSDTSKLDAVREWLDDAYAKLPSQKQVQEMADSAGVSDFLKQVGKKLHIS
jgi:hypothetical protein